jgi:hypothetical protein
MNRLCVASGCVDRLGAVNSGPRRIPRSPVLSPGVQGDSITRTNPRNVCATLRSHSTRHSLPVVLSHARRTPHVTIRGEKG